MKSNIKTHSSAREADSTRRTAFCCTINKQKMHFVAMLGSIWKESANASKGKRLAHLRRVLRLLFVVGRRKSRRLNKKSLNRRRSNKCLPMNHKRKKLTMCDSKIFVYCPFFMISILPFSGLLFDSLIRSSSSLRFLMNHSVRMRKTTAKWS